MPEVKKEEIHSDDVEKQFEQLRSIGKEIEKVDLEILRATTLKKAPLFERRNKITSEIRGFWPHVFEDSASNHGFDEHITPEDAECITAMTAFNVTRPNAEKGDPRDLELTFTFSDNTYMPAQTITKRFIHQDIKGLTGLVSTPVEIKWKEGQDLTGGINKAAIEAFEERKARARANAGSKDPPKIGEKEKYLAELLDKHTSFFNWFSFTNVHEELGETGEDGAAAPRVADGIQSPVEAFSYGDEVAIQLADDVYPNAVNYFTESIEAESSDSDEDSDIDLDSDIDEANLKALIGSNGSKNSSGSKRSGDDDELEESSKKKLKK